MLLLMLLLVGIAVGQPDSDYPTSTGIHCLKCPPGTKVKYDCNKTLTNSQCESCPPHEYSDVPNGNKHCTQCKSSCPQNSQEVRNCTSTTNRVCLCKADHHRYPVDAIDDHFECRSHTRCLDGEGEIHYGNHSHDTQCRACNTGAEFRNGTDSAHPVCQICSTSCPEGSAVVEPCSKTSDTKCAYNRTTTEDFPDSTTPAPNAPGNENIAAIVIGVLVPILIVIAVIIFLIMKRKSLQSWRQKMGKNNNNRAQKDPRTTPLIARNMESIFCCLCDNLGQDWQKFILQLPGWEDGQAKIAIENAIEEKCTVDARCYDCLFKWRRIHPDHVVEGHIRLTLQNIHRNDLIEKLGSLAPI